MRDYLRVERRCGEEKDGANRAAAGPYPVCVEDEDEHNKTWMKLFVGWKDAIRPPICSACTNIGSLIALNRQWFGGMRALEVPSKEQVWREDLHHNYKYNGINELTPMAPWRGDHGSQRLLRSGWTARFTAQPLRKGPFNPSFKPKLLDYQILLNLIWIIVFLRSVPWLKKCKKKKTHFVLFSQCETFRFRGRWRDFGVFF